MTDILLTLCPCPSAEDAQRLGRLLLERKLAGCIQILNGIQSMYWWQGDIQQDNECIMLVKAPASSQEAISTLLTQEHPYECPCIMQLKPVAVNEAYATWLTQSCQT